MSLKRATETALMKQKRVLYTCNLGEFYIIMLSIKLYVDINVV